MEESGKPQSAKVELPRGMYPGRLDDKGRLKLAAPFQRYYENLEEKTLFVTSLDRRTTALYTLEFPCFSSSYSLVTLKVSEVLFLI